MSVLNWFIDITSDGEKLRKDGNPVILLTNHHITYDLAIVNTALKAQFGLNGKVLLHPKVYNNFVVRLLLGSKRDMFTVTYKNSMKFLDIFHEWVEQQSNKAHEGMPREYLIIAPAGMTTHQRMITPMYWKYFACPDTTKVLVNVDVSNPFGVKMRNLSGGLILAEFIYFMMPWLSATVTYHTDAVPDVVTSQEQVNDQNYTRKDMTRPLRQAGLSACVQRLTSI
jgi:hypothetical protein